jgi:hypothetical protein
MQTSLAWKRLLVGGLLFALVTGCAGSSEATPAPEPTATPEPTSCEEAEGICLEVTFDGDSCIYEGPSRLHAGPVTLFFHNESGSSAAVNLVRHIGDETIQDVIDYIGEEPSTKHHPSWTEELGTASITDRSETHTWEGVLEAGIHHMVCYTVRPFGGWFGAGFTVED